jgi:type IV secretory pathway VirB10-like protein
MRFPWTGARDDGKLLPMMRQMADRRWQDMRWGVVVSIAVHAVIAAILLVRLPLPDLTPLAEESVSVELVPPPEEKAPAEPAPEQEPTEAEKPPPPEEPPPAEPQEEQAAMEPADRVPIPVLRPVLEFGDKDSGPSLSDTADLARRRAAPAEVPKDQTAPETPAAGQGLKLTEHDAADGVSAGSAETAPAAAVETAQPDEASNAEATDAAEKLEDQEEPLTEASQLFSENATDDPVARTAMGDLPRGARVEQLCSTELYAQLRHASPPRRPELLPSFRLSRGTVLDVRRAAFRANARWYDLSFRCQVDADATRVVSFAFNVGAEIPKSEWRSRGFPAW